MDLKEIQELIRMMSKSGLGELKIKQGDFEIVLKGESSKVIQTIASAPTVIAAQPAAPAPAPVIEKKASAPAETSPAPAASSPSVKLLEIKSPMVGTFYRSPAPDKAPYTKVGDSVKPGQVVCMIEAMKLFNEIESEISGNIVKIMVEDASPVEYDQVLFLIEPA